MDVKNVEGRNCTIFSLLPLVILAISVILRTNYSREDVDIKPPVGDGQPVPPKVHLHLHRTQDRFIQ